MPKSIFKIGDLVKVKGKTISGGIEKELLPIGIICEVVCVSGNCVEIIPIQDSSNVGYWYHADDLEKGKFVWISESEDK